MLEACVNLEPGVLQFDETELFDTAAPVHILGTRYTARSDQEDIRNDVYSRLWFTYRRGFDSIGGTGPQSDEGWGCMLRCGQMMLGEALVRARLGRDWRLRPDVPDPALQHILALFLDRKDRPFSIHQIAQMGVSEGKEVGEWFGPNTVAQVIKKLLILHSPANMVTHVALDNCLILSDVNAVCRSREGSEWTPLLLVIPLRLGLTSLNPCYIGALKVFLSLEWSLGLLGGRPNHALWVLGCVESEAIYLDPHFCQSHAPQAEDDSFHCKSIMHQSLAELDPSLALAFLATTQDDFHRLLASLRRQLLSASQPPLFEILEERPKWYPKFEPYTGPSEVPSTSTFCQLDSDEEFEILD